MSPSELRVGYVLKMYPRFSETFIVNEILALERLDTDVTVFSLRPAVEGRFHESLAGVRAAVRYIPHHLKAADLWTTLRRGASELPGMSAHLSELIAADVADAAAAVEIACAARELGLGHLHAHFGSVATTVVRLAAGLAGVGYTFTAHAKDIFHQDVDPEDLRIKLTDAAAAVTISDFNLDHLTKTYGAAAERLTRIYNGLDLSVFEYTEPVDRPAAVAAVGRLVEKKGFADLLEATALLVGEGRRLRVDMVGTGTEEHALKTQAVRLGLTEHVVFHGALPQSRVRAIVRNAAVLAAPCIVGADGNRDGLPTVLLEALALGTPCVATPVTGIPEVIRDGETGLLVPEKDPEALAGALATVLDKPDEARRLAAAGRRLLEQHFDINANAAVLRGLFVACATRPDEVAVAR